jgi:hypothetical protein
MVTARETRSAGRSPAPPIAPGSTHRLDQVHAQLLRNGLPSGLDLLVSTLRSLRGSMPAPEWTAFATTEFRGHFVGGFVLRGPITRSAFEKRRGYPGDAETLDLIYGECKPPLEVSALEAEM